MTEFINLLNSLKPVILVNLGILLFVFLGLIILFGFLNYSKKKGFFINLFKSFYFKSYKDLKDNKIWNSVGCISLAHSLFVLFFSVLMMFAMYTQISSPNLMLPEIKIISGVVVADVPQPYKVSENFIIDTTGRTSANSLPDENGILLTKNQLIMKRNILETRTYDLSKIQYASLRELLKIYGTVLGFLIIPMIALIIIMLSIINAVYILIISAILLLYNLLFKTNLKYAQLFNIAVFAFFPIWILTYLLGFLKIHFSFFFTILYLLFLAWIFYDLKKNTKKIRKKN